MKKLLWIFFIIGSVVVIFGCGFGNDEPVIDQLTIPKDAAPGDNVDFQVTAHDADGDALTYLWIVNGTPLHEKAPTVKWTTPDGAGTVTVEVRVSDGENRPTIQQKTLIVGKEGVAHGSTSTFEMIQSEIFSQSCISTSCHSSTTQAGGLSLEPGVAYENLLNAPPVNKQAQQMGWRLVARGQPENSFLMVKLLSPGKGFGNRMPHGTRGLHEQKIEAVRRWILADAPKEWVVPDIPDLRDLTDPGLQANIFIKPPPPAQGFQLHLEPFPIAAGSEREILYPLRPPFEETIYVNRIEMFMAEGSHHFDLFTIHAVNAFPDRTVINFNTIEAGINPAVLALLSAHSLTFNYLATSQEPEQTITFPDGVALPISPAGRTFILNSHYINLNGVDTLFGEAVVNLHTIPEDQVRRKAHAFSDGNMDIFVPPGETRTTTKVWRAPHNLKIVMLTSHMHRHGIRFVIERLNGEVIYESDDWAHPKAIWFDPPLEMTARDGLRYSTTHRNHDKPNAIRFGLGSEDDMAGILGYYYIADISAE